MSIVTFDDSMVVNIKAIDEQHKGLVDDVNKLADAMKAGRGKEMLNDILRDLLAYADYHFKTEEELFKKYKYPEADEHIIEHRQFIDTINMFL